MENPSIMSHVSVGTNDLPRALAFYDAVMATIGARRVHEVPVAVAYGKHFPEFWVQLPYDHGASSVGNGTHFGFVAKDRAQVQAFYAAAIEAGAASDGEPGPRPEYGEPYYGCFVRDLDGHKIECTCWEGPLPGPPEAP